MNIQLDISARYRGTTYQDPSKAVGALKGHIQQAYESIPLSMQKALGKMLKEVKDDMVEKHSSSYSKGGDGRNYLNRRSGAGLKSIIESVTVTSSGSIESIEGKIGGLGYLNIQETGGVITPKKSKYLTIPTQYALNSNGVPIKKKARDWKNTFIATSKKGNLIIFQKRARGVVPLYVLKKSVTIPKRLGMGTSINKHSPRMLRNLANSIDEAF